MKASSRLSKSHLHPQQRAHRDDGDCAQGGGGAVMAGRRVEPAEDGDRDAQHQAGEHQPQRDAVPLLHGHPDRRDTRGHASPVGVAQMEQEEAVQQVVERAVRREVDHPDGDRDAAADGEPYPVPHPSPRTDQHDADHRAREQREERDLQGQGGQADRHTGEQPAPVRQGPDRAQDEEDHRRLLARTVRGEVDEALEAEHGRGGREAGGPGGEEVAGDDVGEDHGSHRDHQVPRAHADQLVAADHAGGDDPGRRQHVGERAGPADDPDVRGLAGQHLPRAVRIDAEVTGEQPLEPVEEVGHERDQGHRRYQRIETPVQGDASGRSGIRSRGLSSFSCTGRRPSGASCLLVDRTPTRHDVSRAESVARDRPYPQPGARPTVVPVTPHPDSNVVV